MAGDNASQQVTYSAAQLREGIRGGDVADAHRHAGLVPDTDARELLNFLATAFDGAAHGDLPDEIEETALYKDIVRNKATDGLTDAVEAGNVSQMQYAVGMVNHDKDASDASTRTWLQNQVVSEAFVGMVTGGMGAGKTDWALELADIWHMATRGRVATNIESAADRNPQVEFVDSYTELEALIETSKQNLLMVLDETGQGLTGYGSDAKQARALASTLKLVRKGDAPAGTKRGVILIGQTVRDASRDLRRLVSQTGAFFHKPGKKTVEVYENLVSGELDDEKPERTIKGIPKTRLDFDTTEGPAFDMTGALGDGDGAEDPEDARKSEKIEMAQRLRDQGMSGTDVADAVGMSKTWVYDHTDAPEGNSGESSGE